MSNDYSYLYFNQTRNCQDTSGHANSAEFNTEIRNKSQASSIL